MEIGNGFSGELFSWNKLFDFLSSFKEKLNYVVTL